jgi:glutathione peroxidase
MERLTLCSDLAIFLHVKDLPMTHFSVVLPTLLFALFHLTAFAKGGTLKHLPADKPAKGIYAFTMNDINGKPVPLSKYKGKVVMIVNVASQCGYTPQYEGLQKLYKTYKDRGFVILGFPANNFGAQEPGTNDEIKEFCTRTYNVTFDMFSKISVRGADQDGLYKFLTSPETDPKYAGDVKWNFQKYLIDKDGNIVNKFMSAAEPMSKEVITAVEAAL